MGTPGFNLDQSINSHINSIAQQGSLTGADEAELRSHLQDTTEGLQKQGLNAEEAFIIACKRLGKEELLTEEYSKVNPSVNTNKLWAYLIIGANLFYSLPTVVFALVIIFYQVIFTYFHDSVISVIIVTVFHILLILAVWSIVRNKNNIAKYIENAVKINVLRITLLSFLPLLFSARAWLLPTDLRNFSAFSFDYFPLANFHSSAILFSGYSALIALIAGIVGLIFSVKSLEKLTPQLLLVKPSMLFLIFFGVIVELLAACIRIVRTNNILITALLFGTVYLAASYLIAYYNRRGSVNKYLITFSVFGISIETIFGIQADVARGGTHFTLYFVSAIVVGVIAGRFLGLRTGRKVSLPDVT